MRVNTKAKGGERGQQGTLRVSMEERQEAEPGEDVSRNETTSQVVCRRKVGEEGHRETHCTWQLDDDLVTPVRAVSGKYKREHIVLVG